VNQKYEQALQMHSILNCLHVNLTGIFTICMEHDGQKVELDDTKCGCAWSDGWWWWSCVAKYGGNEHIKGGPVG
jgi:hypothetical protein